MSNENTTTRLTDTTSRLRYFTRADGTKAMPFVAESGNKYELSAQDVTVNHVGPCVIPTRGIFALSVECSCPGFQTHGHCYHTVQLRHRLAGEPVPSRDEIRAARRVARAAGANGAAAELQGADAEIRSERAELAETVALCDRANAEFSRRRRPSARRVSAVPAIVPPVIETAPAPTKKRRPSARRTH